jgi:small subunit ribosomal protein S8
MCQWFNSTFGHLKTLDVSHMKNTLIKFLIKLKNASLSRRESVSIDFNLLCLEIAELLYKEGFIQSFSIEEKKVNNGTKLILNINLRYFYNKPLLKELKIISTPVQLAYLSVRNLAKLPSTKHVLFLSTSKGFLTGFNCKEKNLGGLLLFRV